MQMILFFSGSEKGTALLEREPVARAERSSSVRARTVRSIVRDSRPAISTSHAVLLIDRPAPVVPMTPRQPAPLPDPSIEEEECERWDGLY